MNRSNQLPDNNNGSVLLIVLGTVVTLFVLAIAIHLISHHGTTPASGSSSTSSSSTSSPTAQQSAPNYSTLSPATAPSKAAECSTPISFSSNGNSGPVTCSNGELNVLEWNALAGLEPTVMTLGYGATEAQVQAALCSDANASDSDANTNNSHAIEATVYQITALYYGWNFSTNPSLALSNGTC